MGKYNEAIERVLETKASGILDRIGLADAMSESLEAVSGVSANSLEKLSESDDSELALAAQYGAELLRVVGYRKLDGGDLDPKSLAIGAVVGVHALLKVLAQKDLPVEKRPGFDRLCPAMPRQTPEEMVEMMIGVNRFDDFEREVALIRSGADVIPFTPKP